VQLTNPALISDIPPFEKNYW